MTRRLSRFGIGSGDKEQMMLFRTLAALLESRIPLVEALDECIRTEAAGQVAAPWLQRARHQVAAGANLSAALAAEQAVAPVVIALVRTAESTGTTAQALSQAADILEMRHENTRTLASALTYPAIIMSITFLAALFMVSAILPRLESMYRQAGQELPLPTRILASGMLPAGLLLAVCAIAIIIRPAIGRLRNRNRPAVNVADSFAGAGPIQNRPGGVSRLPSAVRNLFERIPLLRRVNRGHATALWSHCLGILLRHKVPLPEALAIAATTAADPVTARELDRVRSQIIAGDSPATAFMRMESTPVLALRLLAGGDAAGDLADACERVHRLYDADYHAAIRRLILLAEPLAILVAGSLVILVALSVLLPVAGLGGLL